MRKFVTVLLCIGVVISWQLCQNDLAIAKGKKDHKCSIAGTWEIETTNGFVTVIPTDKSGRNFSFMFHVPIPEDPIIFGVFPGATAVTPFIGAAVKVSPNLYNYSATQFAVDQDGNKLGSIEISGKTKLIDCDTRANSFAFRFLDAKGNEVFPDYCGFETSYFYRYEVVPPCGELLPLPE